MANSAIAQPPLSLKILANSRRFFRWLGTPRVFLSLIMLVIMFYMVIVPLYRMPRPSAQSSRGNRQLLPTSASAPPSTALPSPPPASEANPGVPQELDRIRMAVAITAAAQQEAMRAAKPGETIFGESRVFHKGRQSMVCELTVTGQDGRLHAEVVFVDAGFSILGT